MTRRRKVGVGDSESSVIAGNVIYREPGQKYFREHLVAGSKMAVTKLPK